MSLVSCLMSHVSCDIESNKTLGRFTLGRLMDYVLAVERRAFCVRVCATYVLKGGFLVRWCQCDLGVCVCVCVRARVLYVFVCV